ncbi:restriction endonuclease subunit S [Campylobacter devanensis]|uniref:restriction endonuclease subunit S n=1 Tax=Campylobacter devanensis TaxID=3161138 RepID=UPI000A34CF77|nr:restriction endonuclease subunit S [Campylobacter sp. P0139]
MKSPKIRFKEFQNEWNSRILGDICEYKTSNLSNENIEKKGLYDLYDANGVIGKTNKNPQKENYITIIKDGSGVGRVRLLPKNSSFISTMCAFIGKNSTNFLYAVLQNFNFSSYINGATIPHIYFSDYKNAEIRIPNDIKEQEKIGEFFRKIDGILDLENSRFKKLENFKKTMLDKLFVKDGADEPQIRLGSFKGKWNSRILGDIFKERTERSAVGELLSVSILKGVTKFNELNRWDKSSQDKSNYKVVKKGDIAYNSMRMWQGASGLSKYDGIVSPAYTILEPCENTNSLFFSYMFKKDEMLYKFRIKSQGLTSDTWNLKYTNLKSIEVRIPSDIKEQEKIGEFFRKIDGILEFSQKKITKLENIKKYLLNKMFM